jgi:hypothetical protein
MNNIDVKHCESIFDQIQKALRFRQEGKITDEEFSSITFRTLVQGESECWEKVIDRLDTPAIVELENYASQNPSVSAAFFLPGAASDSEIAIKQAEIDLQMREITAIMKRRRTTMTS